MIVADFEKTARKCQASFGPPWSGDDRTRVFTSNNRPFQEEIVTKLYLACAAFAMTISASAMGQGSAPRSDAKSEPTQATYLLTGLHCPPCTRTVESSLASVRGILTVKVDWKTKAAKIEFDESILPAQRVAQLIAATPHMMGSSLHYGGWLAVLAPEIKDAASGKLAEEALAGIEGVKSAKSYPAQHTVAVYFAPKGELSTRNLIDALKEKGIQAETN
jgi:copper chaperone CopZ